MNRKIRFIFFIFTFMVACMAATRKLVRKGLPPLAYLKNSISASSEVNRAHQGAVFCTGFMSVMRAKKAEKLGEYFTQKGMNYLRFDYTDVGESTDASIEPKYSFAQWHSDVLTVLDELTEGPQIVVGSSMGGWLALLAALHRPEKVAGLLLVAPGVDFFPRFRHLVPEKHREEFERGEIVFIDGPFGQIPLNKRFFTESQSLHLLHKPKIEINCPVRIMHATGDPYAPYQVSVDLISKMTSPNIQVHLIKSDDHRMSGEEDLKILYQHLDSLVEIIDMKSANFGKKT